eukprot:scaffold4810_cov112-Isochrysis_galbana.AAC.7
MFGTLQSLSTEHLYARSIGWAAGVPSFRNLRVHRELVDRWIGDRHEPHIMACPMPCPDLARPPSRAATYSVPRPRARPSPPPDTNPGARAHVVGGENRPHLSCARPLASCLVYLIP